MTTVAEIERAIETLPQKDFEILAAWVEQRVRALHEDPAGPLSGQKGLSLRDHAAFLNSYAPED